MDETMPSLDHEWSEADWEQFSRYHAAKAAMQSKRVPLACVFAHLKCGEAVRERITRLQPNGPLEGERLRGWHPHPRNRTWEYDGMGPREFVSKYGRAFYDAVPKTALIHRGHRKLITREYIEDHHY